MLDKTEILLIVALNTEFSSIRFWHKGVESIVHFFLYFAISVYGGKVSGHAYICVL